MTGYPTRGLAALIIFAVLAACADKQDTESDSAAVTTTTKPSTGPDHARQQEVKTPAVNEPDRATIQYVLVGFTGTANPVGQDRSHEKARQMADIAEDLLKRDTSQREITDTMMSLGGAGGGQLTFLNNGVKASGKGKELPRQKQPGVSKAAFGMKVGTVQQVPHHPETNTLGIWVIKRLN